VVVGEERGGGADLSTHVANGSHTSAREALDARAEIFDNGASTTLDGKDASNLKDNVWEEVRESRTEARNNAPLGVVQPPIFPVSFTPMTLGHLSSQGMPAMTSTASAPPTPQATIPRPPALGVWESVPIIIPPGKA
jgi:hypothetical protein